MYAACCELNTATHDAVGSDRGTDWASHSKHEASIKKISVMVVNFRKGSEGGDQIKQA